MIVEVGCICSLIDDTEIPVYEEVDVENFLFNKELLKNELYSLLRDYLFNKLKNGGVR